MRRTNEEIIAAILEGGSIRAAAEALGIQQKTIYAREKSPDYQKAYIRARRRLVEDAATRLQSKTGEAIDTIIELMKNEEVSPQTRLNCAEAILKHAEKIEEVMRLYEHMEEMQRRQSEVELCEIFAT